MRVLIGGIGYRYLSDGSAGLAVIDRLEERAGDGIEVEDVSYHPVGLAQNLQAREPYDRVILVGAISRDREPGTITSYRWDGVLPDPETIQNCVSEAVTGVISLDNHIVVCGQFGGFPEDVRIVEIEPASEEWGDNFTPVVVEKLDELVETVWTSTKP